MNTPELSLGTPPTDPKAPFIERIEVYAKKDEDGPQPDAAQASPESRARHCTRSAALLAAVYRPPAGMFLVAITPLDDATTRGDASEIRGSGPKFRHDNVGAPTFLCISAMRITSKRPSQI